MNLAKSDEWCSPPLFTTMSTVLDCLPPPRHCHLCFLVSKSSEALHFLFYQLLPPTRGGGSFSAVSVFMSQKNNLYDSNCTMYNWKTVKTGPVVPNGH